MAILMVQGACAEMIPHKADSVNKLTWYISTPFPCTVYRRPKDRRKRLQGDVGISNSVPPLDRKSTHCSRKDFRCTYNHSKHSNIGNMSHRLPNTSIR